MLPSLTAAARRRPPRRAILGAGGAALLAVSLLLSLCGSTPSTTAAPKPMAEVLEPGTWAMSVPVTWFAAPIGGLRPGDRLDFLAIRPGERATATAIAFDMLVISADDRSLVVGSGADDVTALGVARASGLLLIPLLRSTR